MKFSVLQFFSWPGRRVPLVCLQALILGLTLQREPHFTR